MDEDVTPEFWMVEGVDPLYFKPFFTVRVVLDSGRVMEFNSAQPEKRLDLEKIDEKLALLKVSPVGAKLDGVGWRRRENLYYLRIYEEDLVNTLGETK